MAREIKENIAECVRDKQLFLLSGGAGSGKTHTLIETIRQIHYIDVTAHIACITYTNVAADEIKDRIQLSGVHISTIHDFLWEIISPFQKNLKKAIISLIAAEKETKGTGLTYSSEEELSEANFTTIQYRQYRKIEDGVITHDDVLKVARFLFESHPILSKILFDQFPYILVDEYQDTQKAVIDIFLNAVDVYEHGKACIGFFGDQMQSIYDTGIVNIQEYIDNGTVVEIFKEDNYRCSQNVITLLNKLRRDITQKAAAFDESGTLLNKVGTAKFIYSCNEFDIDRLGSLGLLNDWNLQDSEQIKILFLTHKLIARKQGYLELLEAQKYKDSLTGADKSTLSNHILRIAEILFYFKKKTYSEVIRQIEKKPCSLEDKGRISNFLSDMAHSSQLAIETFISRFDAEHLVYIDDSLQTYKKNQEDEFNKVVSLPFVQVEKFYEFDNAYSPYSTQHGIKGAEFDNVLIVLDNGRWNKYNFKNLFEKKDPDSDIYKRTERLFYVCCSRAKDNLIVYYQNPTDRVLEKAAELFGSEQVIELK